MATGRISAALRVGTNTTIKASRDQQLPQIAIKNAQFVCDKLLSRLVLGPQRSRAKHKNVAIIMVQ
jgi:hypothetical protein